MKKPVLFALIILIFVSGAFILVYFEPQSALFNKTAKEEMLGTEIYRSVFRSREHKTTGSVLITKEEKLTFLRFENLSTTNGPDLKVYLAKDLTKDGSPIDFINLGDLKANKGNSNYLIPSKTDLKQYRYVVIWCKRFSVSFADASLDFSQN